MPLRICQVAAEAAPFAKTGGLGDVVSGLAGMLHAAGHDVRIFLPFYPAVARQQRPFAAVEVAREVPLALGTRRLTFSALTCPLPGSGAEVYFIRCPELYRQEQVYAGGPDEHLRFALLTRAALECCQRLGWAPDIVHCHDWHTALAPLYLRTVYGWDRLFARTRSVLTLHNLGYHGIFPAAVVDELGFAPHAHLLYNDDLAAGIVSFLKTGLLYADALTTVSRTYALEIQTPEHGFGLDPLLRARADHLVGIVNGVDYDEWSPDRDPFIPHRYDARDLSGKARMKELLLERLGLPPADGAPVLGMVNRMIAQKGLDLLFDVLPDLLAQRDLRFVALGSGEPRYEEFFAWLQRTNPERAAYRRGYDNQLAHWIEAGADLFLMPSRYEPCGLNQMYSLRYGTPPVVRRTGGLADTVEPYDWRAGSGTGFVFEHFTPQGLWWALDHALSTYAHPTAWARLVQNGMARDFSWQRQGREYLAVYRHLVGR